MIAEVWRRSSFPLRKELLRSASPLNETIIMKLHIPVRLFRAVVAAMTALPVIYASAATAEEVNETLTKDFESNGATAPLYHNSSLDLTITSGEGGPYSYTVKAGASEPFVVESLTIDNLKSLEVSGYKDTAISVPERLTITNTRESVNLSGNVVQQSYGPWGGALYVDDGTASMTNNGAVYFTSNSVGTDTDDYADACGGAAFSAIRSEVHISSNASLTFEGNKAIADVNALSSGGAVHSFRSDMYFQGNDGAVTFKSNEAVANTNLAVGAGVAMGGNTLTLTGNGSVAFIENRAESTKSWAAGAAIVAETGTVKISDNGNVNFEKNIATGAVTGGLANWNVGGGAIGMSQGSLFLDGNQDVTFDENQIYATDNTSYGRLSGGAIHAPVVSLRGNKGTVSFTNNVAKASDGAVKGGAIFSADGSISLDGNHQGVKFTDNTVSSLTSSGYGSGYGGAISAQNSDVSISGNKADIGNVDYPQAVVFKGNSVTSKEWAEGGAISFESSSDTRKTLSINDNQGVLFEANKAYSSDGVVFGGAICVAESDFEMKNNGALTFLNNVSQSDTSREANAHGGAITVWWDTIGTISDNAVVSFEGNEVISDKSAAAGGAIHVDHGSAMDITANGKVSFSGNKVTSTWKSNGNDQEYGGYAGGAAIVVHGNDANDKSIISFSQNGEIEFIGNAGSSSSSMADGSAVAALNSDVIFSGNENIKFEGNTSVGLTTLLGNGGALAVMGGKLSLIGNDDVLFKQNATVLSGAYRLTDIAASELELSANAGKKIEFHGSVYSGSDLSLNADYTAADGTPKAQTGDIIFTGATTEADLKAVKKAAGTQAEIDASRTTQIKGLTTLHNGRLIVEAEAVYNGLGLQVVNDMTAAAMEQEAGSVVPTVVLDNGKMIHDGAVSFAEGTKLSAAGISTLTATTLTLASGSEVALTVSAANAAASILTYTGELTQIKNLGLSIAIDGVLTNGSYALVTLASLQDEDIPNDWAKIVSVSSGTSGWTVGAEDLVWEGNTLYLNYENGTPSGPTGAVPEPTTATLSLLALAALAARRRRR